MLLAAAAHAHVPIVYVAGPDEDWCAVIDGAIGNDLVMLEPGVYQGPCAIEAEVADLDHELTTVQSLDPLDPPVFVPGQADHVLSVSGHRLILFQLAFADLPPGVDAVRVDDVRELHVRFSTFTDLPGTAVRLDGPVHERLELDEASFTRVGTAVDCPSGACAVGSFVATTNLLEDVGVGYVLTSDAEIEDDLVVGAGTAVRALGGGAVTIDRVLYQGRGPLVDVRAGPLLLRSSIVLGGDVALAAPGASDVHVLGSTLLGPLDLAGWGPGRGLRLAGSAVDVLPEVDVDLAGTVACPDRAACFTDVERWDLYPAPGSPLLGAGLTDPELALDWCGRPRSEPPTAGAFDAGAPSPGPVPVGFKDRVDCPPAAVEPPPTTTPPTSERPPRDREPEGCGCRTGGGAAPLLALLLAQRARRRTTSSAFGSTK